MRRSEHGWGLALFCCAAFAVAPVNAQVTPAAPVVVVVDPAGGLPSADQLSALLAQELSLRFVSLREVAPGAAQPQAMITVSVDREHLINVVYWDRAGRFDVLSAPVKSNVAHVDAVALTLASALLQRHLAELRQGVVADAAPAASRNAAASQLDAASASRFLYDALGRLGLLRRRTIELSIDEF
jgi:hypothetical protein